MTDNRAESKKLNGIERLILTAHLIQAISVALVAIATALRLSRDGRLHEATFKAPEQNSHDPKPTVNSPKDYFAI